MNNSMGQRHVLFLTDNFKISLDIDDEISLGIGTGFTSLGKPSANFEIPLSVQQLGEIVGNLDQLHKQLKKSTICMDCGRYNIEDAKQCANCLSTYVVDLSHYNASRMEGIK